MIRKLLICPYFGDLPDWFFAWAENMSRLREHGYRVIVPQSESEFRARVSQRLGINYPENADPRKPCAYRPAFGVLYADLIDGYDFWGHTDLDCVLGRVQEWVTDEFLDGLDIHSNHRDYICGPWTLYRDTFAVNDLFMRHPNWRKILEDPNNVGWAETSYTRLVDAAHDAGELRRVYTHWQTHDPKNFDTVRWDGDRLLEGDTEIFMAHFRHTKAYPPACAMVTA